MMKIIKGTIEDIEEVSQLWLEMVKELAPSYEPRVDWWQVIAKRAMEGGDYRLFILKDDESMVGFVDFFIFPEPSTGMLHSVGQHLYVQPAYRDNKMTGRLWRAAIKEAKNSGSKNIELCCFDNEQSGWQKKGFVPVRTLMRRNCHV